MTRPFTHLLRLGTHAEQEYLVKGGTLYDELILNANLVEGTSSALAVLVTRLQKPYYIDPVTYAFALSPSLLLSGGAKGKATPKRTFRALAEAYGLPADLVGMRPIQPDLIQNVLGTSTFTQRVLEYQRQTLAKALEEDAAFLLSDVEDRVRLLGPVTAIAPYFVEDLTGRWGVVNLEAIQAGNSLRGTDLAAVLAVDSRLLTPQNGAELGLSYGEVGPPRIFIWLTDFDEHAASVQMLRTYANLVDSLARGGKEVIASYGGFFSLLLAFRGMTGSSHGIGYGDKRDLEPVVGGGLPPARYYFPPVRDGISLANLSVIAAGLSADEFRERVCPCSICQGLLENGGVERLIAEFTETEDRRSTTGRVIAVPTRRVYKLSRWHFLQARAREFDLVRNSNFEDVVTELLDGATWARDRLGSGPVSHVWRWVEALRVGQADD